MTESVEALRQYCLAMDLKDDPELIAQYRRHHQKENVWPEITQSIRDAGILDMQIYLTGNRLFMIMVVDQQFTFEAKGDADKTNAKVLEWEHLMDTFQQALPWARPGEKWVLMEKIYSL